MLPPLPPAQWSLDHAAHLLRRAGFGGTPEQVRAFHALGLDRAVDTLLHPEADRDPRPEWTAAPAESLRARLSGMMPSGGNDDPDRQRRAAQEAMRRENRDNLLALRQWWLERMRAGRRPCSRR